MAYLLIVDDDADFADAAATLLRADGHEVETEPDTGGALQSILRRRPDLLVLDVMFPENATGGFDFARELFHEHQELRGMPVLLLTAINVRFPLGFSERDIDEEWLPVSDFVEKPVDFDLLRQKITHLLASGGQSGGNKDQ